ncbi:MAG TPA: LptF/LptG family permease [Candidatus Enterousia avicola]|uniref:LptF/LptG family permease n=1 Tax=Candidatus Enterousia avicola TaxID=2840787 RepID=A0A9D1SM31_9PROT|nr:LptF/LptG family permease [Candidatus Enterousia avicola]
MRILNRYFTRQLVAIFIMLLLVLTGLAWMLQIMSMMKFLLNYGVDITSFLGMTMLMIPFIVSIIIPFVTFIAIIFVYNKLISDNEITVMTASGLSPRQLARPALILALVLTVLHFMLNVWVVPKTQAMFYSTQWNLRYGLAHLKLQESAFTQLADGLVVYVDKVSGHDLSQVMLSDMRDKDAPMTIFAEKGKLVSTDRGLSIVMTNGSLQAKGDTLTTGTFDKFDMDLNVADKEGENSFKVRRVPTSILVKSVLDSPTEKQHKMVLAELSSRFFGPIMNLILAALCATILLRSSLLRRRASFAPALAVAAMAAVMSLYMSTSNMIESVTDFILLLLGILVVLFGVLFVLFKK